MNNILWCTGHPRLLNNIVKAENCFIFDADGNKYIDLESGEWAVSLGHSHPRIVKTLKDQSERIVHNGFFYISPVVEKAAETVLDITGLNNGKCVFHNSGSEAVEFSVKLAKAVTENALLFTFSDSYHGAYGTVGTRKSDDWYMFDWSDCQDCEKSETCDKNCEKLKSIPFNKIGSMVFEPGSSAGKISYPPSGLVEVISEKIINNGGLILVNEITTGVGRTGKWFGFQHYNIKPDMVAVGKGVGSGYPVSAVAMGEEIIKRLNIYPFKHSQSHQNDPLGAAVALEVISIIKEEKLLELSNKIGNLLSQGLKSLADKYSIIKEVRGRGLMLAVELIEEKDDSLSQTINQKMFEKKYIIGKRPGLNLFRIDPPLTIPEDVVKDFLEVFDSVLGEIFYNL